MICEEFNEWRNNYFKYNDEQHHEFMKRLENDHPVQIIFNKEHVKLLFNIITDDEITVTEMGGWKGEMADFVFSLDDRIKSWTNMELCKEAVNKSMCHDEKYHPINCGMRWWKEKTINSTVFISSDSIEHISAGDFVELSLKLDTKYIYIDSPLLNSVNNCWSGYLGTHINMLMWEDIIKILELRGYYTVYITKLDNCFDKRILIMRKK